MPSERAASGAKVSEGRKVSKRERRAVIKGTKRRQTISIVGAGRLGTALARALHECGYEIESVVARRRSHARRAAELSGARPLALTPAQLDRLPASDILIITTPDDAIAGAATQIADATRGASRGRTALHASGALSSDALAALRRRGFSTGSMHPLVAVSDPLSGAGSLRGAFYCLEGERQAVSRARSLVGALDGRSFSVRSQDKALYHAAAVMTAGHVVALFDIATEMLTRCGLTERRARTVLLPLLRSTLENLSTLEPPGALTGTFARADTTTVRRHLAALRPQSLTEARAAYALLGLRSLRLAERAGAGPAALKEIEELLRAGEQKN